MTACSQEPDFLGPVNLGAIGARVQPAFFGVAGDAVGAGADITTAIIFVPDRGGKLGDVNIVAGKNVFENRAIIDDFMFAGLSDRRGNSRDRRSTVPIC